MPIFAKGLELLLPSGTNRWVGLLMAEPDVVTGTYQEVVDTEYVRQLHTAWLTVGTGDGRIARVNDGAIVFNALVDADETIITHWAIFDAATGGSILVNGPVLNSDGDPQPAVVVTNNQPRFNASDLRLLSSERVV